ncbi:MAG: LacI family transcriptional regulator [Fastidiosipila sp.]|nr:LacI family transcriptional regulator [Fastidiosipila sp.]
MGKITMRALAKICGVSPATVSLVLNNKKGVGENTRQRVLLEAERQNYELPVKKINTSKDILLMKYCKTGVFVEENQGFISMIINAIENQLSRDNYRMTIYAANQDLEHALNSVDYSDYIGAIIVATEMLNDDYSLLQNIPIPFIIVDNTVPNYTYASVCMNNSENVWQAMKHCKDCGHKSIGYLGSTVPTENFNERYAAFMGFIKTFNFDFSSEYELRVNPSMLGAYDDFLEILKHNPKVPSCYFAENDTIALGVMKALQESNYKIPDDISIIGFDNIPFASISIPALTTIHVQRNVIGRLTVCQLLQLIDDPQYQPIKCAVTGKLVIRDSVKKIL